jgi:phosphatidylglycerophosphate synthase
MTFLKLTKNKTKLFLSMIVASFVVGALSILINRFLILNFYLEGQIFYHQLINFFVSIIRYIAIAYLAIVFYKKKISPQGEYYAIFKIAILLLIFSFLYHLFLSYIAQQAPDIFFSNWVNAGFVVINLAWYYVLTCIVYNFKEIRSEKHEK